MFTFPQFRSEAWIRSLLESQYCHPAVLADVDLTPEYMASNPSAALYKNKSNMAKEQIRRALFRHALFKVQNVEVTDSTCKDDRVLTEIVRTTQESFFSTSVDRLVNDEGTKFVSEEVWNIQRCGEPVQYSVRYYREGNDGFSTRVVPHSFLGKIGMLRYYFS